MYATGIFEFPSLLPSLSNDARRRPVPVRRHSSPDWIGAVDRACCRSCEGCCIVGIRHPRVRAARRALGRRKPQEDRVLIPKQIALAILAFGVCGFTAGAMAENTNGNNGWGNGG